MIVRKAVKKDKSEEQHKVQKVVELGKYIKAQYGENVEDRKN